MRRSPALELLDRLPGQSFALNRFHPPAGWPFTWHRHDEWELTLITVGQGVRFIGDSVEDFAPGDVCLIPPHLPHTWMSRPAGLASASLVLHLPSTAWESLAALPEGAALRSLQARAAGGLHVAGEAGADLGQRLEAMLAVHGLVRFGHCLELLAALNDASATPLASHATPAPGPAERRLARVLAAVEERLADGISQAQAAALVGMPPASFSRFFHTATGRTFVDHLGRRRIAGACRDLIETDDRVLDIALRWGWQGLAAFNRRFRAITGFNPRQWRQRQSR